MEPKDVFLSIVIPVFNEEKNIEPLTAEIIAAINEKYRDFEIIFVNDGSTDGSINRLKELNRLDTRVKAINFRKNFGQSSAISAGFEKCSGNFIVTLDGDMQNDPSDIPRIVEKLLEGYDMVNGWRKDRKDKLISRLLPSYLGNKAISLFTRVKLHDIGCTLRGYSREIAKGIKLYGEMHRYVPAIVSRMGIDFVEIPVNHRVRKYGDSKYGLGRTFRVLMDLVSLKYLLSFAHRPLHFFGSVGFFTLLVGLGSGFYLTYVKFVLGEAVGGRPLLIFCALSIFVGFQMITLGLIAEMLTRIYHEGFNKNIYSIKELIGFDKGDHENINDCTWSDRDPGGAAVKKNRLSP